MTGKLKVVRVLANPISKRKKSAKVKRRKGARQRAVRSLSGIWLIRRVSAFRTVSWWTGSAWSDNKHKAQKFSSSAVAARSLKKARARAGTGWIVIDVLPA